jgi:hypothetical protein
VPNVDEPHEDADDRDDLCEHVTEVVQLTLQGSLFADLRRNGLVNVTDGRILTCEDGDRAGAAIDDGCTLFIMDVNTRAADLLIAENDDVR